MTLRNRKQFHYKFHEKTAKIRFYSVSKELICNTPRLNFQKELLNYHGKQRKPSKQLEGRKDKHKRDVHGWIKFLQDLEVTRDCFPVNSTTYHLSI